MEELSRNEALLDALVNGTTPPEIEPKSRMEAYLQALLEKGVGGGSGGGAQPDWNQNDETAPDYVKNRPCYKEVTETVVYEEQVVESDGSSFHKINGSGLGGRDNKGKPYAVIYNGNRYEFEYIYTVYDFGYLGNGSLIMDSLPDTGEPFVAMNTNGGQIKTREATTCTIEIIAIDETIHPLDEKYMPNHTHDLASIGIGYCVCTVDAAESKKTAILENFVLKAGSLVGVLFTTVNTATGLTLNIENTGAKYILNFKTNANVKSGDMGACLHLFMYDGSEWVLLNPLN